MTELLNSRLADTAPALLGVVVILAPIMWLFARAFGRAATLLDKWFSRHESAEESQFKLVELNTAAVAANTTAVMRLADRISHTPPEVTMSSALPVGEPIYTIPPIEREPEMLVPAHLLRVVMQGDDRDWGHEALDLPRLHDRAVTGEGVLVAVLDTGVDASHPDLKANVDTTGSKDYTGSRYAWGDRQGHGSHCSGIVAADDDGKGLVGSAPDAKVVAVKVLNDSGSGASSWIAAGIRYAADAGADIISMSLGGPSPDNLTRAAVQYAVSKGCWVVAAAGNSGPNSIDYPGAYPECISVAAVGKDLSRASFSSTNREVDIAAPGVSVMSTIPGGRYAAYSGTSMATPYVAGCLALVRGELKRLGLPVPGQVELMAAMKKTARDLAPVGPDTGTGAGLIQPVALLALLAKDATPPKPPEPPTPEPLPDRVTIESPELARRGVKRLVLEF